MDGIRNVDWVKVRESLDAQGFAQIKNVLSRETCEGIVKLYSDEKLFRSTIHMQRYRFGLGEYKYFTYPLPSVIQGLRQDVYQPLVSIANDWMRRLSIEITYPNELEKFLALCHSKSAKTNAVDAALRNQWL